MNIAASLMLGWTWPLLWAAERPLERSGVLGLTAIVVACLMLAGSHAVVSGFIRLASMLPVLVLQGGLAVLFLVGYQLASHFQSRAD